MSDSRSDVVVIGLGSILMSDEGIGVHIVRKMAGMSDEFPGVSFLDLGAGLASVVHVIANRRKVMFVDCMFGDLNAGDMRRFVPDDVKSRKIIGESLHDADLFDSLALSERLGEAPSEVIIFGIQPDKIEVGEELSQRLAARMPEYIEAISLELKINA